MEFDLIIQGGTAVTGEGRQLADIGVAGGKIAAIASPGLLKGAGRTVDASGLHVLPGAVDGHVHFRDPGHTEKEDFSTGSRAAAHGGVTTVLDMPNTDPRPTTVELWEQKMAHVAGRSYVDYGLAALLTDKNLDELSGLARAGAVFFKTYMAASASKTPPTDDGQLFLGFLGVAETGLPVLVHAENQWINVRLEEKLQAEGRGDWLAHLAARPAISEREAISRCIMLSDATGVRMHIPHMSSKDGVELVRAAKDRKAKVTAETCPQYFLLSADDYERLGPIIRINPPVRGREHGAALLAGLLDGTVDFVATDHSPHQLHEKQTGSVWTAVSGFVGVETSLPLMLDTANKGSITLEQVVRVMSENPARFYGLWPRKGRIAVGSDADFALVDLKKQWTVVPENLHSKTCVTPFQGRAVKGAVVTTVVRGNVVLDRGQLADVKVGQLVRPS